MLVIVLSVFTYVTCFNSHNNLESDPHFTGSVQLSNVIKIVPLICFRVKGLNPGCIWVLNLWSSHYPAVPTLELAFNTYLSIGEMNDFFPAYMSCHWAQIPKQSGAGTCSQSQAQGVGPQGLMTPAAFSPVSSFLSSACA